jgi:nucleotide-binding universal stress UspA family protein
MRETRPALLCFDGSPEAAEAIRAAGTLLPGRESLVLAVAVPAADEFPLDPIGDLVGRLSSLYADWDEIAAEVAEGHARNGCELAAGAGLPARPLTAAGKPAPTILRVAEEHDVAVIVLGGRAHGGLLRGGLAARLVGQSSRPVLVIPHDDDESPADRTAAAS